MDFNEYDYDSAYNDEYDYSDEIKRIVPDTSAIIEGELEHQANNQRHTGIRGLENIKKLQDLAEIGKLSIRITGRRPTKFEKDNAKLGEIDGLIRDVAKDELALLLTSDKIQAKTA